MAESDWVDIKRGASDSGDWVDMPAAPVAAAANAEKWYPGKAIIDTAKNIPSDLVTVGKSIGTALLHPINTAKAIGDVAAGGVESTLQSLGVNKDKPQTEEQSAYWNAVEPITKSVQDPSSIIPRMGNFIQQHPVQTAMNVSAALGLAGKVSDVASLTKASEIINPVNVAAKAAEFVGKTTFDVVGAAAKEILGGLTEKGSGSIEGAMKSSPEFLKAMRGEITGDQVVDTAKAALSTVKNKRSKAYLKDFTKMGESNQIIDISPIKTTFQKLKDQYYKGGRTALGEQAQNEIAKIEEIINDWGSKPIDHTAIGLDMLKRQLGDFYSESSQARQFVTELGNKVKETIIAKVPEYKEMMSKYENATNQIKDFEAGLMLRKQGMTGRVTADMTLRRLTSAMKDNFALRKDLVEALGEGGNKDLASQIAGYSMSKWRPPHLEGKLAAGALLYYINPKFLPIVAASSPRVVGEFLHIYSKALKVTTAASKGIAKATIASAPTSNVLYQTGKVADRQYTRKGNEADLNGL